MRSRPTAPAPEPQHDDATLLTRIGRGDEAAMATLYDRYARLAYAVTLRVLRHPAAAEKLVEDLFLDLWRHTERFQAIRGDLGAWLVLAARNQAVATLQLRQPRSSFADVALDGSCDLSVEAGHATFIEESRAALLALPQECRKALGMAFFDGLTHVEISEITGESSSAVRERLCDTLLALRQEAHA